MREQMQARLDELKRQYQLGEGQLRELSLQESALRETLLRIAGAIQVLEELMSGPASADQNGDRESPEMLTVP